METLRSIVVTGGAGFVGSCIAMGLQDKFPAAEVWALDNLQRRGSELNLPRLAAAGVRFVRGDVRRPEDLLPLPPFDLLVECSADPSVHAGSSGSPLGVIETNLIGMVHCLELARTRGAAMLFLSSSRIYPIAALRRLRYTEGDTRFVLRDEQEQPGCSAAGVAEDFPLVGARSFYGATKLAGELMLQEYVFNHGMRALVYRCGVIAGPWQMGKVDQGFLSLWVARHHFGRPLRYIGYGGTGKQVRDVLHVEDLADLVELHLAAPSVWDGRTYNVGGGRASATSLCELTRLCQEITGRTVPIESEPPTSPLDVPIYVSDSARLQNDVAWRPKRTLEDIVTDTARWVVENEASVEGILG